eukprot:CAMPEP_0181456890 /NCGR_PEP_ID=MMETSP1110-20121109/31506_1 /TAXON_ID=174948 /ORGANISM="Symbiodinium sp., Strain CCMP421" /LENGTH=240 /DNA_ID=CAMNT_0023581319 /DNA_START=112 /DNA_END=831 /DNA_ORIENTATION=-
MQQGAEDREALLPGTPNQDLKDQNAHEAQVQEGHQLLLQRLEVAMLSEVASNSHSQCDDNKEADHSQRPQPAKELVVHLRLEVFELRHGPLFFPHLQAAVGFANGAPLTEEHHQMGKVNKEVDARQDCSHQSAQTPWLPEVPPLGGPRQHLLGDLLELCLQPGILRAKLCITPSHLALFALRVATAVCNRLRGSGSSQRHTTEVAWLAPASTKGTSSLAMSQHMACIQVISLFDADNCKA